MQCSNRELSRFAGNAQRGWVASTRGFVEEMDYSHRETLQFAVSAQTRLGASIQGFVQETRSPRQQLVWFACVTACLAYALGQAKGEDRYLKRMHIFLDKDGMELQDLESQSWLVALAMWALRSCWTVSMGLGRLIGAVLTTSGRVIRMSVGGIPGAVHSLSNAASCAGLWMFALLPHVTNWFRRSSGIFASAQTDITAPTSPLGGSPEFGSLSTLSATGQPCFPAEAETPRVAPSPAAMWLAGGIHQLLSTGVFLLDYPSSFVCDFLTASFEIIGIHRLSHGIFLHTFGS